MKPSATSIVYFVIGVFIIGFVGLMSWGLANKSSVTSLSGIMRVGQPAPDFMLNLFDETTVTLAELEGQPVVINFWASWCPPCREESVVLEQAWRAYRERGVWIVGVDIQDTDQEAIAFLSEFEVTYPNGPDSDGEITVAYGVNGLPTTFFVNRNGIVERRWVGAISEDKVVEWIDNLISGLPKSDEAEGGNLENFFLLDNVSSTQMLNGVTK